ncbi:MAG: endopeptidase La [Chloroflexi bacterium]|nr:endopeptidase La [Chloroflexota bacterium]
MDIAKVIETQEGGGEEHPQTPQNLPVLPLKNTVIFPQTVFPLVVQKPRSVRLIDDAVVADRMVALVALRDPEVDEPTPEDLYSVGTLATIHRLARTPDGTLHLVVQGVERIQLGAITQRDPYMRGDTISQPDMVETGVEMEALVRSVSDLFRKLMGLAAYMPEEMAMNALNTEEPRQLAYLVASLTRMELGTRQRILEETSVAEKLRILLGVLAREVDVLELGQKIKTDAQSGMEKVQREYFLREQMKAIQKELGEEDEQAAEIRELRERIEKAGMPEEAHKEALRELDRMSKMPSAAAEYSVIRTYLQWLGELPWQVTTEDHLDITVARQVLDEDHYDLTKVKDRIVEYLAVRKLRQERKGQVEERHHDRIRQEREGVILCFVGPPGVGKTSLGKSIARAVGREFIRQSLGGLHDEAEIRGHRRTYIGAMPGRVIQAIRRVGTRNPVFMLDEVDKIGADFHGDPSSALLEVLDPEQNREFRDNYLDVAFDLSQVMFITTANVLDTIPAPLRDRMEILYLPGYTEEEKVRIARGYLVPRQIKENGLHADEVSFEDDALYRIIREYTREAGVRELEREIGSICRKVATKIAEGSETHLGVTEGAVTEYLGKQTYYFEVAERTQIPGVATGLAWTSAGGDILFIEATKMKGDKGFTITGQLGDVMKESAMAALSYVRSNAAELGIDEDIFAHSDIHLHIPAGSTPKDGPSAGVTIATALASLMMNKPVSGELGMTGEITLRGQVLPVGGIKEKVLAAHRAGLKRICLPKRNTKDLDELPEEVRNEMTFILVDRVEQVFAEAFGPMEGNKRVQSDTHQDESERQ